MDCLLAQQMLSEAADGGAVDAEALSQARLHCDACADCAAFSRGLELLGHVSAPTAPTALIDSILSRVASEPTRRMEASFETTADTPHEHEGRDLRPSWWAPRLTLFATAAVILLSALTLTAIGYFNGSRQLTPNESGDAFVMSDQEVAEERSLGEAPETDAAAGVPMSEPPAYISVSGRVYDGIGTASAGPSTLTTIGPVDGRSLENTTAPVYAYDAEADDGSIVIQEPGTGWTRHAPIVRRFAANAYQLRTQNPITAAGRWPDLPAAYTAPTDLDGSPTFRFFGYDESGTMIFVPVTGDERDGFAIAPGTPTDDPAAGNPNWTWWAPLP